MWHGGCHTLYQIFIVHWFLKRMVPAVLYIITSLQERPVSPNLTLPSWGLVITNIMTTYLTHTYSKSRTTTNTNITNTYATIRAERKSQVRQCLGFCAADYWVSLAY